MFLIVSGLAEVIPWPAV